MRITTRRAIITIALALGLGWNCLCLAGVLPLYRWPFSCSFVGVGCAVSLLPLAFPALFPGREASNHQPDLPGKERVLAGMTLALGAGWGISVFVCLLFPGLAG